MKKTTKEIVLLIVLFIGSVVVAGALQYRSTFRQDAWYGFYLPNGYGELENTVQVQKSDDTFKTVEECENWARYIRSKRAIYEGAAEDAYACAKNCLYDDKMQAWACSKDDGIKGSFAPSPKFLSP